jgi:hypothetical protein
MEVVLDGPDEDDVLPHVTTRVGTFGQDELPHVIS